MDLAQLTRRVVETIKVEASDEEAAVTRSGDTGNAVDETELADAIDRALRAAYAGGVVAGRQGQGMLIAKLQNRIHRQRVSAREKVARLERHIRDMRVTQARWVKSCAQITLEALEEARKGEDWARVRRGEARS